MGDNTKQVSILRVTDTVREPTEVNVVREFVLTIKLNGTELAVLSGSPSEIGFLAAGLVQSQGIIKGKRDIVDIHIEDETTVDVITSGDISVPPGMMLTSSSGRSSRNFLAETLKAESTVTIRSDQAFDLMERFEHHSSDFKKTGGVHSAALCRGDEMLYFSEDIGRHNAVDKVFGKCLLDGVSPEDLFLITSGRVSSDIMLKIVRRRVPVLIARNSPTDAGIGMAEKAGITLLGFVRDTSMNVYTHPWRVV